MTKSSDFYIKTRNKPEVIIILYIHLKKNTVHTQNCIFYFYRQIQISINMLLYCRFNGDFHPALKDKKALDILVTKETRKNTSPETNRYIVVIRVVRPNYETKKAGSQ